MKLKKLIEQYPDVTFYEAVGFDDAIVGFEIDRHRLIYDIDKMIKILKKRDGMTKESALQFLEYNTFCAYMGSKTPLFIYKI